MCARAQEHRKDYEGAEQMFLRAIRADRRNAANLYNFACFRKRDVTCVGSVMSRVSEA